MAEEVVRTVVFDIHGELRESFEKVKAMLRDAEAQGEMKDKIAAAAELRKHIALASRTLEVAIRADAVREFQAEIIEILADAGVVVRRRVLGMFEQRVGEGESGRAGERENGRAGEKAIVN